VRKGTGGLSADAIQTGEFDGAIALTTVEGLLKAGRGRAVPGVAGSREWRELEGAAGAAHAWVDEVRAALDAA